MPADPGIALIEAMAAVGATPVSYVRTNAGHSAIELQTALALTAIMDRLPPIRSPTLGRRSGWTIVPRPVPSRPADQAVSSSQA
ncbi:hypothetical protein NF699_14365 [Sphingomonadaceae bacterium OTU29LAMAA1]|nr:hypothetical protein NF699_14365 [Sphingomonadaceae bacterium OTU29LAMAA1]